jgi:phosphatidate cytidylyltransferase
MTRIVTSAVGILVMIPICFFSHTILWPLALSVFSLIAVYEMLTCIGASHDRVLSIPSYCIAWLPLLTHALVRSWEWIESPFHAVFFFVALYFLSVQILSCLVKNRIHSDILYRTLSLILYIAVSFTAVSEVRFIDHGNEEGKYIYLLIFLGAWCSDTFAYFAGRLFGKTPLAPAISPKKTVEGSIGGILANMIVFAGYAWIIRTVFSVQTNILFFAILGALFAGIGQFGDLFASCIKRHYQIKDYGKMFPGHGGVLDRFDSILAIALTMFLLYAAFGSAFLIS